jgi:hypothetical protein
MTHIVNLGIFKIAMSAPILRDAMRTVGRRLASPATPIADGWTAQ